MIYGYIMMKNQKEFWDKIERENNEPLFKKMNFCEVHKYFDEKDMGLIFFHYKCQ